MDIIGGNNGGNEVDGDEDGIRSDQIAPDKRCFAFLKVKVNLKQLCDSKFEMRWRLIVDMEVLSSILIRSVFPLVVD